MSLYCRVALTVGSNCRCKTNWFRILQCHRNNISPFQHFDPPKCFVFPIFPSFLPCSSQKKTNHQKNKTILKKVSQFLPPFVSKHFQHSCQKKQRDFKRNILNNLTILPTESQSNVSGAKCMVYTGIQYTGVPSISHLQQLLCLQHLQVERLQHTYFAHTSSINFI